MVARWTWRRGLAADRSTRGRADELGVLGKRAAFVARRQRRPSLLAAFEVRVDVERALGDVQRDPVAVADELENAVKTVNAQLARHETIKRFALLEHDFSVEDGLLTASLKPRRREIEKRYADVLDGLY